MNIGNAILYDIATGEKVAELDSLTSIEFDHTPTVPSAPIALPRSDTFHIKNPHIDLLGLAMLFGVPLDNVDEFKRLARIYKRVAKRRVKKKLYNRMCKVAGWR